MVTVSACDDTSNPQSFKTETTGWICSGTTLVRVTCPPAAAVAARNEDATILLGYNAMLNIVQAVHTLYGDNRCAGTADFCPHFV